MKKVIIITVLALVGFVTNLCAYDFSADVVTKSGDQSFTGKMYVSGDKSRMEVAGSVTISDMGKKVVWILMPDQKMYMEQPINPEQTIGASEKAEGEIERKLIGPDTVDGKNTLKYLIKYSSKNGETSVYQWIDTGLNLPVKTSAADGSWSTEYKNISTGSPAPDLFIVPEGYKKMSMPNISDMMPKM